MNREAEDRTLATVLLTPEEVWLLCAMKLLGALFVLDLLALLVRSAVQP
jgi:hypothetical protein